MKLYVNQNNKPTSLNVDDITYKYACDVLVVGAGCAGVYCAISCAQEGAKVILLENGNSVGGMHTEGNVHGYYYGFNGGEFEKIDSDAKQLADYFVNSAVKDAKQITMLKALNKANVTLLTDHTPIGLLFDETETKVEGVLATDGKANFYIKSTVCIDATSDGYLIKNSPVTVKHGRDIDGKTVPFSVIANYVWNNIRCGVNQDAGHVNQYDLQDFSNKILFAHKESINHFEKGAFLSLANRTGLREGVSFVGEETLRYQDVILDNPPQKPLFWAYSDLDRHGNDRALDDTLFQKWWVVSNLATVTMPIAVPLGSVIPKGIKGLATAGRCLSIDTYAQSAVRMIRDMFRLGECVGVASALALKTDGDIMAINYDEYLSKVKSRNCFHGALGQKFGFDYPGKQKPYKAIEFNAQKSLPLLETQTPAVAIWSCYLERENKELLDQVYALMVNAKSDLHKYNCALALGNAEDKRALPVLREMTQKRDCFYFKDCRRSNQFRSVSAICLLGHIGEKEDIPLLEKIVFDNSEFDKELYHTLEPNYLYYKLGDRNFVYFDVWTHSGASLVKLYKKFGLPLKNLNLQFEKVKRDGIVVKRITQGALPNQPSYDEITGFIDIMIDKTK